MGARVFTFDDNTMVQCVLALRTGRGWYFAQPTYCKDGMFRSGVSAELKIGDVLKAPGKELVAHFSGTDAMKDYDEEMGRSVCCTEAEFEELVVCGIGPSQAPSCTPAISLKPPIESKLSEASLVDTFNGDELILERADGKAIDDKKPRLDASLRATAGRHRISFK
jgi:hypothetical protein